MIICTTCKKTKNISAMSSVKVPRPKCKVCRAKFKKAHPNVTFEKPLRVCPVIKFHNYRVKEREWRKENFDHREAYRKEYRTKNPNCRKGESQLRQRTVYHQRRVFNDYRNGLIEFYRNCPKGFQVDHIVPILNDNICGLHVPWNLQYLPSDENNRKHNKWDGTMDNANWRNK